MFDTKSNQTDGSFLNRFRDDVWQYVWQRASLEKGMQRQCKAKILSFGLGEESWKKDRTQNILEFYLLETMCNCGGSYSIHCLKQSFHWTMCHTASIVNGVPYRMRYYCYLNMESFCVVN